MDPTDFEKMCNEKPGAESDQQIGGRVLVRIPRRLMLDVTVGTG